MASPNARIIALRESRLYSVLPNHLRQPWIDHTLALGDKTTRPGSQEKFESEVDCLQRLNAWGFATGCAFVTLRSRPKDITPSWQFTRNDFPDAALGTAHRTWRLCSYNSPTFL